jgi:hypothetical protein
VRTIQAFLYVLGIIWELNYIEIGLWVGVRCLVSEMNSILVRRVRLASGILDVLLSYKCHRAISVLYYLLSGWALKFGAPWAL